MSIVKILGIVTKGLDEKVISTVEDIIQVVQNRVEVKMEPELAALYNMEGIEIGDMDVDIIVSIGGDGTILRALQSMKKPTPIVGINLGIIGFLNTVKRDQTSEVMEKILEGFEVEKRERIQVLINDELISTAINEVVVITSKVAKMLHCAISADGVEIENFRADGVVFATPTGSTAYAMSAGGPIVDPRVRAIIIVPIAPFKLTVRPYVLPLSSKISLKLIKKERESLVVIDGQQTKTVCEKDTIIITRSKDPALFVKTDELFFSNIRNKLG